MRGKALRSAGTLASMLATATLGVSSPAPADTGSTGCSWPLIGDRETLNVGYPDDSATYWGTPFVAAPGSRFVVRGEYPRARYFSLHVYDNLQRPTGSLADYELEPDPGSGGNPYASEGVDPGTYTAYIEFQDPPAGDPASNTIYAGKTSEGAPNPASLILYRVYVPDDPASPTGGVPLPEVGLEVDSGEIAWLPMSCDPLPPSVGEDVSRLERESSYLDEIPRGIRYPLATDPPFWERFFALDRTVYDRTPSNPVTDPLPRSDGGFFSNRHIAYVRTRLSREFGDVVVLRARAPGFPDTRAGESVTEPRQLRYWSVCSNELASQRMMDCLADHEAQVDGDGFFTIVVSDPADRPANVPDADGACPDAVSGCLPGVSWLPWGGPYFENVLIYRHMLPAGDFDEAVQNVPERDPDRPEYDPARETMGEYLPASGYCDRATFEAEGWAGCIE